MATSTPTHLHLPTEIELLDPDFDSTLDTTNLDLQQFQTILRYYEQPQLSDFNTTGEN